MLFLHDYNDDDYDVASAESQKSDVGCVCVRVPSKASLPRPRGVASSVSGHQLAATFDARLVSFVAVAIINDTLAERTRFMVALLRGFAPYGGAAPKIAAAAAANALTSGAMRLC